MPGTRRQALGEAPWGGAEMSEMEPCSQRVHRFRGMESFSLIFLIQNCGVNPVSEQKPVLQEYGGWSSQPSRSAAGDPSQQTVTDGGIQKVNMEDGESIFSSPILLDPFPFSLSSLKPMDQTWDASSHSGHAHCGEQRRRLPLGLCVTHTN